MSSKVVHTSTGTASSLSPKLIECSLLIFQPGVTGHSGIPSVPSLHYTRNQRAIRYYLPLFLVFGDVLFVLSWLSCILFDFSSVTQFIIG
jgi:hypothetical protein